MSKIVYNYDPSFYAFTGISHASPNPLEPGKYLIPAFATEIAPPESDEDNIPVFDEETNTWSLVENHYGEKMYNTLTKESFTIDFVGPVPEGYTLQAPPGPEYKWSQKDNTWVIDQEAIYNLTMSKLKNAYKKAVNSPLVYNDTELLMSQEIQQEIQFLLGTDQENFIFLDVDFNEVVLTKNDLKEIATLLAQRYQDLKKQFKENLTDLSM